MDTNNPLIELAKSVAQVTQKLREMRLRSVLLRIAQRKTCTRTRRLSELEAELAVQTSRKLRSGPVIDELLSDLEALLDTTK